MSKINSTEMKKIRTRARRLVRQGVEHEAKKILKRANMSMRDLTEAALMALISFEHQGAPHDEIFIDLMLESKDTFDNAVKETEKNIIKAHNKIRSSR